MADISKITLPNGQNYNIKDSTARNAANSAVPNTRTVNGKALSSDISLGAGDVGAYTKKETDTKINAAIASAYKYKGSVTADKLPTSGQVVGDVYNITNDSSYGKAGMNVAWTGTTWDALGSNVDLSAVSKIINDHIANKSNPHGVTKAQVGLGNVDNTADSAKSVKYAASAGNANAVAWGNVSGRPSSLPANGGNSSTVNGHTVNSDVPSGAKFTDTVTTVTTTGSGNAVTAISASNGSLTATKDATFATKQESSNHVIASKTQPSNQQAGDIWMIISDSPNAYDQGDLATYGSATQEASS